MNMKFLCVAVAMSSFVFAKSVSGVYMLPKDSTNQQSIVEVFEKDGKYYGVGFATTEGINKNLDSNNPNPALKQRPIRGSVFLNLDCGDKDCKGNIYSFEKGKNYPVKASLKDNKLQIKVDVMFGPTLVWDKLSDEQAKKYEDRRLDTKTLDTKM